MNQAQADLNAQLDAAIQLDNKLRSILKTHGYPEPRIRAQGFTTMLSIIVSQQISTKVAATIWGRLEALCNDNVNEHIIAQQPVEALRKCGLSKQKIAYTTALAERIIAGQLCPEALLDMSTEDAIKALTEIKGFGIWSAEIYAMFALGRADIFPAGDLALQIAVGWLEEMPDRPSEKQTREIAMRWSPHQSAVALLMWRYYGATTLSLNIKR